MTLARNSLRCRAYASSDSRLSRVIMPLCYESGLDLREGERHLAARRHRHAQLAGDLRDREDAAHHRALHHQRMLAAGAAQRLQHVADAGALDFGQLDHLDALRRRGGRAGRSEEHTSELQSHSDLVCRLLLEKKKQTVPHQSKTNEYTGTIHRINRTTHTQRLRL